MNCKQTYKCKIFQNDRSVPGVTGVNAVVSVGVSVGLSGTVDVWLTF